MTVDAGPRRVPHQWTTRDGGRSFHRLEVGGRSDASAVVLSSGLGYAKAHDGQLWRTVDGGQAWRPTAVRNVFQITATSTPAVGRLRGAGHYQGFSAVTNRRAFMRFGYGLTVTHDAGRNWRSLHHLPRRLTGGVSGLSIDGRTRYLALGSDGLWKSPDAGAHWQRLNLATK